MEAIQTIIYVLIVIAAILLILLTLAQSNKGSDLGLFGGSTDMVFGSQKGNILTRMTAIFATIVIGGTFLVGILRVYVSRDKLELEKKQKVQEVKTLEDLDQAKPQGEADKGNAEAVKNPEETKTNP